MNHEVPQDPNQIAQEMREESPELSKSVRKFEDGGNWSDQPAEATAVAEPTVAVAEQPAEQKNTWNRPEKRRLTARQKTGAGFMVAAVIGTVLFGRAQEVDHRPTKTAVAAATPEANPSTVEVNFKDPNFLKNFTNDLKKDAPGFKPGEIAVGTDVDFSKNSQKDRGTDTFGDRTINSYKSLTDFLASKDKRAVAARQQVEAALKNRPDELNRALNGDGYLPVQFKVPIGIEGTTYLVSGHVYTVGGMRRADSGDIFWLFVDKQGHIVTNASLRADCHNPKFHKITPMRISPKHPVPLPGPDKQKGSGGSPEQGMDPQNDSDQNGYGPHDTQPTPKASPTPEGVPTGPETTPSPNPTDTPDTGSTPPPPPN